MWRMAISEQVREGATSFVQSHYIPIFRVTRLWPSSSPGEKSHFNISRLTPYRSSRRVVNTGDARRQRDDGRLLPRIQRGGRGNRRCSGRRPSRITKLAMPHRMPKVRVPDIVRPNYLDASPHNGPITKLPCHLRNPINIINGPPNHPYPPFSAYPAFSFPPPSLSLSLSLPSTTLLDLT